MVLSFFGLKQKGIFYHFIVKFVENNFLFPNYLKKCPGFILCYGTIIK